MKKLIIGALAVALVPTIAVAASHTEAMGSTEKQIMAIARAQMDAGIAQKPQSERMISLSDDYTVFNPGASTRIDGKASVMGQNVANSASGSKMLYSEMLNPRVQVYGDTAILTFNGYSINQARDGSTSASNQKVTRVYVRQGGAWKNVHAHFSLTTPPTN